MKKPFRYSGKTKRRKMSTGQTMLTLVALMLFGMLAVRINSNKLLAGDDIDNSKYGTMAVALAKTRIDNATALKYDEKTVYGTAYPDASGKPSSGGLTASQSLGPESGETLSSFDDFDDYNGYVAIIDTLPSAIFTVRSRICYVDPTNGFAETTSITWSKMIEVTVTSVSMKRPLSFRSVNSYWKY
jgi:hypothetical protein